jgi:hypothetical protein
MLSCDRIDQEEMLLTRTYLINVNIFVFLFIAFCDINDIMHGSTITHESIRKIF